MPTDKRMTRAELLQRVRQLESRIADSCRPHAHAELDQRVGERTCELQETNEALHREIAERERAQEELRSAKCALEASLAQLEAVVQSIDQGLLIADTHGEIRLMNRAAMTMHGYFESETPAKNVADLRQQFELFTLAGKKIPSHQWPLARALAGETFSNYELRIRRRATNENRIASLGGTPVRGHTGDVLLAVLTVRDITDQKRAEKELKELNERLEERVAQRTALSEQRAEQLRTLASQLTQTEQRERRRLAQLLHDHLQQLLVAAKMQVGMLVDDAADTTSAAPLQHILDLLQQSITASRTLTMELSPPVLYDANLAAALNWLARWMKERHSLHVDLQIDEPAEPADDDARALLFEIVRELLFNVVKHAGVDLAHVRLSRHGARELQIVVSDAGVGVDISKLQAGRLEGGFGLSSACQRLELIGGMLRIHSAAHQGTHIILRAPLGRPPLAATDKPRLDAPHVRGRKPPHAARPESRQCAPHAGAIRLLVVDDHQLMREGLIELLERTGDIEVVGEASDGLKAVELAAELHPDVVIMDVNMPKLNGIAATRRIRLGMPEVRVIGLSLHEERDMAAAMIEAGATTYITKGGRAEELMQAIRNACPAGSPA